jgi:cytochrome oxidase Cu insertion factor (SCO1/SenC/PrrC family)
MDMDADHLITGLLEQLRDGDETALARSMPVVYEEMRRIAQRQLHSQRAGHTLVLRALDEPPGDLDLRDHRGERITAARFAGAPLLVTFAFGRCETVCPVIVKEARAARQALGHAAPPLVIITVDPWRDAPLRLPHIAEAWELDEAAHLLGGAVDEVERVLDSWRLERVRDARTGDVAHPSLVYVLDGKGRIRFGVPGWRDYIVAAVGGLGASTE